MNKIILPISKSIANRLLMLNRDIDFGVPDSDLPHDVLVMRRALHTNDVIIDVEDCGTAMRFLTAYFSIYQPYMANKYILTGSQQLCQRPIEPLVDALRQLGAKIEYVHQEGYPPLSIFPQNIEGGYVQIKGNISSQFISAIKLISHLTSQGITINITAPIVSSPYIALTDYVMANPNMPVEADWSSAAFWYEYVAINKCSPLLLHNLSLDSCQGDKITAKLFNQLGVKSTQTDDGVIVEYIPNTQISKLEWNFTDCPDLYPAVVTTCLALKIQTSFTGTETLRYKESNRIEAINQAINALVSGKCIPTSNDHRIVMAIAMLKKQYQTMEFDNPSCVNKSYPMFWQQLTNI